MKRSLILSFTILLTSVLFAQQRSTAAVKQTINTMMDAMRKGDSTLLRSVLAKDYKFYLGTTFSHCGVNFFQLAKTEGGWKIIHIAFTTRKDNCTP